MGFVIVARKVINQVGIAECGSIRPCAGRSRVDGHEAKRLQVGLHDGVVTSLPCGNLVAGDMCGSNSASLHNSLEHSALVLCEGEDGLGGEDSHEYRWWISWKKLF